MKKRKSCRCILIALSILIAFLATSCGSGQQLRFGSAGFGGNYFTTAQTIADFLTEDNKDLEIEVKVTAGSAANLRLLSGKYIQLAISQADVLNDSYFGTGMFEGNNPIKGYSAIAGLYKEACQIITLKSAGIESIKDLRGKTVSVGEAESGTEQNAKQILLSYGLNEKLVKQVNLTYADAADKLLKGEIDAFFCTSGVQTTVVEELAQQTDIYLIDISPDQIRTLLETYDYYSEFTIPAGTYTGQDEDVKTIGVKAVLLASDNLSENTVKEITESLFKHTSSLQSAVSVDFSITPETSVENIPVPFHKGAIAYYKEQGISVSEK